METNQKVGIVTGASRGLGFELARALVAAGWRLVVDARGAEALRSAALEIGGSVAVDPGDMRTQMHQDAFPGEDISDRPLPSASVPGLLHLIEGSEPSGRYRVQELVAA